MRISDWSSDVCSSDLSVSRHEAAHRSGRRYRDDRRHLHDHARRGAPAPEAGVGVARAARYLCRGWHDPRSDRKSVVKGKSVSVRVDLGGRRLINKKPNEQNKIATSKWTTIKEK